ncbi:MAG: hypothetical protein WCY24_01570 [Lutispora sp.]
MMQREAYSEILNRVNALLSEGREITVAIDGNSGSGKSTLSSLLGNIYDCNIFHMDDFFLQPGQRTEDRMKEVGGNVDYVRFKTQVLDKLKKDTEFEYQIYDCSALRLTDYVVVFPKKLNIVEGVYSMHPTLYNAYDFKIFLQADEEIQRCRILQRSGEYMLHRFLNEWIPLESKYFSEMNIAKKCDLVLTSLG